ncbi:MAG: hypothetical protein JO167_09435 [Alphaproteobacteria bacterium]|nr:hypothetical protein [Alphaproteobacteria bacterium]
MTVEEIEKAVAKLPAEQFAKFRAWLDQFELEQLSADGVYHATEEELRGIDRGLREADAGKFATAEEVTATFAKFRTP